MVTKEALKSLLQGSPTQFFQEVSDTLQKKSIVEAEAYGLDVADRLMQERTEGHVKMVGHHLKNRDVKDYPVPGWDGINMEDDPDSTEDDYEEEDDYDEYEGEDPANEYDFIDDFDDLNENSEGFAGASKAQEEGRKAGLAGKSRDSNPYKSATKKRDWLSGYKVGSTDRRQRSLPYGHRLGDTLKKEEVEPKRLKEVKLDEADSSHAFAQQIVRRISSLKKQVKNANSPEEKQRHKQEIRKLTKQYQTAVGRRPKISEEVESLDERNKVNKVKKTIVDYGKGAGLSRQQIEKDVSTVDKKNVDVNKELLHKLRSSVKRGRKANNRNGSRKLKSSGLEMPSMSSRWRSGKIFRKEERRADAVESLEERNKINKIKKDSVSQSIAAGWTDRDSLDSAAKHASDPSRYKRDPSKKLKRPSKTAIRNRQSQVGLGRRIAQGKYNMVSPEKSAENRKKIFHKEERLADAAAFIAEERDNYPELTMIDFVSQVAEHFNISDRDLVEYLKQGQE